MKILNVLVACTCLLALASCGDGDRGRKPARSLYGSWTLDSLSSPSNPARAGFASVLIGMASRDTSAVYQISADSVRLTAGNRVLASAPASVEGDSLFIGGADREAMRWMLVSDSVLVLSGSNGINTHLKRDRAAQPAN